MPFIWSSILFPKLVILRLGAFEGHVGHDIPCVVDANEQEQHRYRSDAERRYATLVAILLDTEATLTDEILDMHDRMIGSAFGGDVAPRRSGDWWQGTTGQRERIARPRPFQSGTVTRKKVAGMHAAPLRALLFWALKRSSNSLCRSAARPFFSAASNAFMVGP